LAGNRSFKDYVADRFYNEIFAAIQSYTTMYTWIKAFKEGRLSANEAVHTPKNALSLNDELIELRKRVKEQDKEIRRLKEENEFLEEASAFFAASRRKSAKNRD